MKAFLTIDDIIERALLMISQHELFKYPIVLNKAGLPMRITKLRNYDSIDTNENGLTLSIFPYAYQGTSNETVGSNNAAVTYKPYNPGNAIRGFDEATLALIVQLTARGTDVETTAPAYNGAPVYEKNWMETYLYRWGTILRAILLTKPLENLGGLVKNSNVNWLSYRTPNEMSSQGKAIVFHRSALLWEIDFNAPRNVTSYPVTAVVPNTTQAPSWHYVGVRSFEKDPVYWDDNAQVFTTMGGQALTRTPGGLPVAFDLDTNQFVSRDVPPVALTSTQLLDNRLSPPAPWIDTTLRLVGVLLPSRSNLYWNTTLLQLQLVDGTVVTALEDGTLVFYDATQGLLVDAGGTPFVPGDNLLPLNRSVVNIYDANSLILRDRFYL